MAGRVEACRIAREHRPRRGARRRPGAVLRQVDRHRSGGARRWRRISTPARSSLSLQNGVENAATIARHVRQTVVPAVVYVATAMPEPGVVKHYGRGDLVIGPIDARPTPRRRAGARGCRRWSTCSRRAQVPVRISRRRDGRAVVEADGELRLQRDLGARAGAVRQAGGAGRRSASCSEAVVREVVAVAAADGVTLPLERVARGDGTHRRGDAGAALVHRAGHGARQAERDRPPQRLRRPPRRASSASPRRSTRRCTRWSSWSKSARPPMAEPRRRPARCRESPTEFAQALRELGPGRRRDAARPAARPAACRPTSGASTPRAARSAPSARCRSCASPPTGARRSSATCYEARWMQVAQRGAARLRAARARPASAPRRAGDELPRAGALSRCGSRRCATATPTPATARAVGAVLARIHALFGRAAGARRRSSPTDAIFFDIRLEPYLLATARAPSRPGAARSRRWWRRRRRTTRRAGARRRQPEEHPGRRRRPGVARRRVRLVGRPGVRPRLLPQPPAAEVPVDAGGDRGLPGLLRRACREPTCDGVDWEPRDGARAARRRAAAGPASWRASTASRRSSTSPTRPTASAVRRVGRGAAAPIRVPRLSTPSPPPGAPELDRMNRTTTSVRSAPAASGTAAAGRRSRPR